MNRYYFEGTARKSGAIGVRHSFNAEIRAETLDAAKLKLYDTWEHIRISSVSAWTADGKTIEVKL